MIAVASVMGVVHLIVEQLVVLPQVSGSGHLIRVPLKILTT